MSDNTRQDMPPMRDQTIIHVWPKGSDAVLLGAQLTFGALFAIGIASFPLTLIRWIFA